MVPPWVECVLVDSVGRPRKRWIDTVKDCLKKRFGCQVSKEAAA